MAVTVQLPKGVRHVQGLGGVYKDEDPLFCSNGSFLFQLQHILQSLLLERGTEGGT